MPITLDHLPGSLTALQESNVAFPTLPDGRLRPVEKGMSKPISPAVLPRHGDANNFNNRFPVSRRFPCSAASECRSERMANRSEERTAAKPRLSQCSSNERSLVGQYCARPYLLRWMNSSHRFTRPPRYPLLASVMRAECQIFLSPLLLPVKARPLPPERVTGTLRPTAAQ